ncbi:MAG: hypothetical protein JNK49_09675 [Planctomycetes bacterium]|nr:hypothetical protein [Planctomycetota bacterium]
MQHPEPRQIVMPNRLTANNTQSATNSHATAPPPQRRAVGDLEAGYERRGCIDDTRR